MGTVVYPIYQQLGPFVNNLFSPESLVHVRKFNHNNVNQKGSQCPKFECDMGCVDSASYLRIFHCIKNPIL